MREMITEVIPMHGETPLRMLVMGWRKASNFGITGGSGYPEPVLRASLLDLRSSLIVMTYEFKDSSSVPFSS
jgi:hypothetical protein